MGNIAQENFMALAPILKSGIVEVVRPRKKSYKFTYYPIARTWKNRMYCEVFTTSKDESILIRDDNGDMFTTTPQDLVESYELQTKTKSIQEVVREFYDKVSRDGDIDLKSPSNWRAIESSRGLCDRTYLAVKVPLGAKIPIRKLSGAQAVTNLAQGVNHGTGDVVLIRHRGERNLMNALGDVKVITGGFMEENFVTISKRKWHA
jgi:hypothetical protein